MTNLKSKIVLIAGMLLSALFATGDDLSGIRVEVVAGTPLRILSPVCAGGHEISAKHLREIVKAAGKYN